LWQSKYIDDAVWKIWQYEIQRTLACPLTLREWSKIQDEFTSYPEFLAFVKEAQKDVLPASGFTLTCPRYFSPAGKLVSVRL
jgi:hypothetical protein